MRAAIYSSYINSDYECAISKLNADKLEFL